MVIVYLVYIEVCRGVKTDFYGFHTFFTGKSKINIQKPSEILVNMHKKAMRSLYGFQMEIGLRVYLLYGVCLK